MADLRLLAGLVGLGLLAACTEASEPATGTTTSELDDPVSVLDVAAVDWFDCLDPVLCVDEAAAQLVFAHVLPRLLEPDAAGTLAPSSVLAAAPAVVLDDAGQQVIEYRLSEAARWHDGRPITSTDLRATWLAHVSTPGAPMVGYERIVAVDDRDPLVARVTLAGPWADWGELFGGHRGYLLQADALGPSADATGAFADGLGFGAGPFEVVQADDERVVLAARAEHWDPGRQAQVDQVRIVHRPSLDPADAAGLASSVDLVVGASVRADGWVATSAPTGAVLGLLPDRRTPALGAAAVRSVVAGRADPDALLEDAAVGAASGCAVGLPDQVVCATGGITAGGLASVDAVPVLEADGWVLDPELGFRVRGPDSLAVPISIDPSSAAAAAVAEVLAERLTSVGFLPTVVDLPVGEWLRPDRAGGAGIAVFALDRTRVGAVLDPYRCVDGFVGVLAWCEEDVRSLVADIEATPFPGEREQLLASLARLVAERDAWVPLALEVTPWSAVADRVGVADGVAPLGDGPLGGLHRFAVVD